MSGGTDYRVVPPKTYPSGRVCEAKRCTTRLSVYNEDHLCARCEKSERMARFEVERLARLEAERLERLWEAAHA
jgi:hypothetical protein